MAQTFNLAMIRRRMIHSAVIVTAINITSEG
jgi:hypothetical protein